MTYKLTMTGKIEGHCGSTAMALGISHNGSNVLICNRNYRKGDKVEVEYDNGEEVEVILNGQTILTKEDAQKEREERKKRDQEYYDMMCEEKGFKKFII